ncbi:MAG: DEAD/DEAH box helicase [Planctomycetota bacterium]
MTTDLNIAPLPSELTPDTVAEPTIMPPTTELAPPDTPLAETFATEPVLGEPLVADSMLAKHMAAEPIAVDAAAARPVLAEPSPEFHAEIPSSVTPEPVAIAAAPATVIEPPADSAATESVELTEPSATMAQFTAHVITQHMPAMTKTAAKKARRAAAAAAAATAAEASDAVSTAAASSTAPPAAGAQAPAAAVPAKPVLTSPSPSRPTATAFASSAAVPLPVPPRTPVANSPDTPSFEELGLSESLLAAVRIAGYPAPTPIQARTIPHLLAGRDLLGQAQTGSGKTAAFALPLLHHIDVSVRSPQVLVMVPTRELALQATAAFERYAAGLPGLQVAAIYGGAPMGPQFSLLNRGVHVVVGTPGRVMDHMDRGSLKFQALRCLVLDEADEMLRMGFAESVDWILERLPATRQTALFSATMPEGVREIAQQQLRDPVNIEIQQRAAAAETIRQRYVVAAPEQKEAALLRLLEAEPYDAAIIFVKLRGTTEPLAQLLSQHGHSAAALNGEMAQAQRERIIEQLKSGQISIVVATDVAARGLDVRRVSHVINYDLPRDRESYVHRIGRTGRAGRSGEAILFMHPRGRRILQSLERATRQTIEPMPLPNNRVINKHRIQRFNERILAALTDPQHELLASVLQQFRRDHPELTEEQVLGALGVLATGGRPMLMRDEFRHVDFDEPEFRDRRGPPNFRGRPDNGPGRREPPFPSKDRSDQRPESRGPSFRRDAAMETFRLEVGHVHAVKPGNIVGAIANEAGLDSSRIGRIEIHDDFSTVDLPAGMPDDIYQLLRRVRVAGQQLRISRMDRSFRPRNRPDHHGGPRRDR